MFDGFGKLVLWVLAIVGGVVVVRKYGPRLLGMTSTGPKQLSGGGGAASSSSQIEARGAVLVPCTVGGSSPGKDPLQRGVQSSPFYRWCYIAIKGDSAGSIAERVAGDTARYTEILVANPSIPKKGAMGTVHGADAWDFADGSIEEGTKIVIPETMNAWIDQMGRATGGYLPWPPDPRSIIEAHGHEVLGGGPGAPTTTHSSDTTSKGYDTNAYAQAPAWNDGFHYVADEGA